VIQHIELQASSDNLRSWTDLQPTGLKVWFPKPEHGDQAVYDLRLVGVLNSDSRISADAFYRTNSDGNFTLGIDWLRVGSGWLRHLDHEFVQHDPVWHEYTVRFAYTGQLTLALAPYLWPWQPKWCGTIHAEVYILPADTMTKKQREELELKRAKEERRIAKVKADAADEAAEFARIIEAITIRARTEANWSNPAFRDKFARVHGADLLKQQREIRAEATQFLEQTRVVGFLRRHHPDVVEIVLGRLQALQIAERLALDDAIAGVQANTAESPKDLAPNQPKRKLTTDEVRTIKLNRQRIHDQDHIALKMDRLETQLMIRQRLQSMSLDDDERQMVEEELMKQIQEGDDDGTSRTI